jgi:hypothetical protein
LLGNCPLFLKKKILFLSIHYVPKTMQVMGKTLDVKRNAAYNLRYAFSTALPGNMWILKSIKKTCRENPGDLPRT